MRRPVIVSAVEDDEDQDNESVTITHSVTSTDSDYDNFVADDVRVTVSDDDAPVIVVPPIIPPTGQPVTVRFERGSYSAAEGGDATVGIVLSGDPGTTVFIQIQSEEQGETSNSDYSLSENRVLFSIGETRKEITFTATQDTEDDDGESVKLSFSSLPTNVTEGTPSETIVYINDDDASPGVMVSRSSLTIDEGGSGTYTVRLNTQPTGNVTVTINDPRDNSDVTAEPPTLTFNPNNWEDTQTVTVSAGMMTTSTTKGPQ